MSFLKQHKSLLEYMSNKNQIDPYGIDYSKFIAKEILRDQITRIINSEYQPVNSQQSSLKQVVGAIKDLARNYFDMKRDNTVKGDNYFHCKANYEATQRGRIGEKIAEKIGNAKEEFDFWDNQIRKGLSPLQAYQDKINDRTINQIGRQRAKSGLYKNSREACNPYRVEGINEKY